MNLAESTMIPETPTRPREETTVHTRMLRLALGVEESRAYWMHVDPTVVGPDRTAAAFEKRWFGAKSDQRVRTLLANFAARYDAFPDALEALRAWTDMTPHTRRLVCHWHAQLADPLYRAFTGDLLPDLRRRGLEKPLNRDLAIRWVAERYPDRWSHATCVQFGSKLLSAVSEAHLASSGRDPRSLPIPDVPDDALEYLLYLLRSVEFEGTYSDNPYLRSVELFGSVLDRRLRGLQTVSFHRMGDLVDFNWSFPTVADWARSHG